MAGCSEVVRSQFREILNNSNLIMAATGLLFNIFRTIFPCLKLFERSTIYCMKLEKVNTNFRNVQNWVGN